MKDLIISNIDTLCETGECLVLSINKKCILDTIEEFEYLTSKKVQLVSNDDNWLIKVIS